jgi:hypothetical protein
MQGVLRGARLMGVVLPVLAACGTSVDNQIIVDPPVGNVTTQWDATILTPGVPAEAQSVIAVPNRGDFTLTGLSPVTGQNLWTRVLPAGTTDFGAFGDLFVSYKTNAPDSTAATFIDPISGFNLWSIKVSAAQPSPVLRINETIVASINDTLLVGLDRKSGLQAWRTRLAPLTCTTPTFCGRLRGIGSDRGDGYILRQSSVEAQIITVRETGVVSQVVTQSAILRRASTDDLVTAVSGTASVGILSIGDAAAIDAATGAERWRTALSALVPASYSPVPSMPRFIPDGTLLIAPLADSTAGSEVILDMKTGQKTHQRAITRSQFTARKSECGSDGYVYTRDDGNGFDYVNARTGATSAVQRAGLAAAIASSGLTNAFAVSSGYIVYSAPLTRQSRQLGVKCTP